MNRNAIVMNQEEVDAYIARRNWEEKLKRMCATIEAEKKKGEQQRKNHPILYPLIGGIIYCMGYAIFTVVLVGGCKILGII